MIDNYFFLQRLTNELNKELKGFTFVRSISQSKNELVCSFFKNETEKFLIFTFQKKQPLIFLKDQFAFAKKNFVEFFEIIKDLSIKNISIDDFERNLRLNFGEFELIFLFRASHSNVVLINSNNIIDAFKNRKEIINHEFFEIFPSQNIDSSYFKEQDKFNSIFLNSDEISKPYLNILGKTFVNEIKFRSENSNKSYFLILKEILQELESSSLFIYEDGTVSFFQLNHKKANFITSSNIFEDLPKYYFNTKVKEELFKEKLKILKKLRTDLSKLNKKLHELEKPENFIDHSNEFREKANLILIHSNTIKKGQKYLEVNFNEKNYKIKLDVTKSPFENAEDLFEKAKEEKSRLKSLEKLIEKTREEILNLEKRISEIEKLEDPKEIKKVIQIVSTKEKQENNFERIFRHFKLKENYDIYVGKDSRSNDILTTQFANSEDLWFHARGYSGSHVIIRRHNKKEEIPKEIIKQAAQIAAFYSKGKHSKLVPVAYTEKKYVIKKKGMPPGTVQLLKEKIIMVEPKLPTLEESNGDILEK